MIGQACSSDCVLVLSQRLIMMTLRQLTWVMPVNFLGRSPLLQALESHRAHLRLGQLHQHLGCWLSDSHLLEDGGPVVCDDDLTVCRRDLLTTTAGRGTWPGSSLNMGTGSRCQSFQDTPQADPSDVVMLLLGSIGISWMHDERRCTDP